jgi:threonine/homoserine/homoserine lactone efflux protein
VTVVDVAHRRDAYRPRAIFVAFEALVDGTVGLASGRIGSWLSRRRRARQALDAGSGTIMVALAGRLALER